MLLRVTRKTNVHKAFYKPPVHAGLQLHIFLSYTPYRSEHGGMHPAGQLAYDEVVAVADAATDAATDAKPWFNYSIDTLS